MKQDETAVASFPASRLRRLRMTEHLRAMVRETHVGVQDFIYPLFVVPGTNVRKEVSSMPGVYQMSVDRIVRECAEVRALGIPAVIFFGIPEEKDEAGSGAYDEHGVVQEALRAVKRDVPGLVLVTDVCLCEYTSHGHCGIVRGDEILNDESVELLVREAVS
ncbi:MAG TPA: porphobilinogen synthase, partial [Bacteroidota bacterium]|nr:porphobilinogen synthase [Bacteroidota bacterium]